jgi:hypothetical protein
MRFTRQDIPSVLTYRYAADKHVDSSKQIHVYRPKVEIRLSNREKSFKIAMLVDSGADVTLIPLEIADILGLDLGKQIESYSASDKFVTQASKVNAELLKGVKSYDLGEMEVRVPVKKIQSGIITSYALLGRSHFFKIFDVTFRENTLKILLKRPKKH